MVAATPDFGRETLIPYWPWGYAAVGAAATASVLVAPLAAYVFMIALFGLPHVLCELRYCDERFSARAPRGVLPVIGILLLIVAGLRIAQPAGWLKSALAMPMELGVGVALALVAAWFMPRRRLIGAAIGIAIAIGIVLAPITTFLVFAWLHNLTPLGFIAEIVPPQRRKLVLLQLSIPFLILPAFVAIGLPQYTVREWLGYAVLSAPSLFHAGRYPLSAFLTGGMPFPDALTLFSAAVTAQAMHYLSVILVMPRLIQREGARANPLIPWPSWRNFYMGVGALALLVFAGHAADYKSARAFYGIAAAIHSWVELPIFLLALGAGFSAMRKPRRP